MALPARPVPPENFHVTLAFLGSVSSGRLGELQGLATDVSLPPCALLLTRAGWFPRPQVAFVRPQGVPVELKRFHRELGERLAEAGFRFERRPWRPHVTLYRDLRTSPANIPFEPVPWRIDSFSLMRSVTAPQGARYEPLGHWKAMGGGES